MKATPLMRAAHFNTFGTYSTDEEIINWYFNHDSPIKDVKIGHTSEVINEAIDESSVNKYARNFKGSKIDVYDVLMLWDVTNPAIQHAIKKLLQPGKRGHKDMETDLKEALRSVERAIELEAL